VTFFGCTAGGEVEVETPSRQTFYEVLAVSYEEPGA
jgi:hypothetical protein